MDPPKLLAYLVILCFERRYPKRNSVARLKSNISPPVFWAGCATAALPELIIRCACAVTLTALGYVQQRVKCNTDDMQPTCFHNINQYKANTSTTFVSKPHIFYNNGKLVLSLVLDANAVSNSSECDGCSSDAG